VQAGIVMIAGIELSPMLVPKLRVKRTGNRLCRVCSRSAAAHHDPPPPDSVWVTGVLPGMLVFGLFMGVGVPAVINAALHNVTEQDSGLASDIRTTAQRVGSALGPGRLATLALRHGARPDPGRRGRERRSHPRVHAVVPDWRRLARGRRPAGLLLLEHEPYVRPAPQIRPKHRTNHPEQHQRGR
jgi:hypothetical protein